VQIRSARVQKTSPLRGLFQAALHPYLSMVHHWLTTGDPGPSDPYNEFLLPEVRPRLGHPCSALMFPI